LANVVATALFTGEVEIPINGVYLFSAMIAASKLSIRII
jgi:hypothetical protein